MTLNELIKNINIHLKNDKNLKTAVHHLVNYITDDWKTKVKFDYNKKLYKKFIIPIRFI